MLPLPVFSSWRVRRDQNEITKSLSETADSLAQRPVIVNSGLKKHICFVLISPLLVQSSTVPRQTSPRCHKGFCASAYRSDHCAPELFSQRCSGLRRGADPTSKESDPRREVRSREPASCRRLPRQERFFLTSRALRWFSAGPRS